MAFIKINKQNFYHNINQIALQTGSVEKIAIVLKDNAYGHGLELIAKLSSGYGIKHAVVRDISEAKVVQSYFDTVLVLAGGCSKNEDFSFAINSLEDIDKLSAGTKVELKVDTGMHRNGVSLEELSLALEQIKSKALTLVGLMTHYRCADKLSSEYFWQRKRFEEVVKEVKSFGFTNFRRHSHNSAAILRTKSFDEDVVRVGIAAYGYDELDATFEHTDLKPVLSLHAKKVATKHLKPNERVGYGATFIADKNMTVSTYNIGYGDGWLRSCATTPYSTEEGLCVLGRVSMDLMSFESSEDEICIMSNARKAAEHFGTISYEVITSLNSNIEKFVV
jgi:alanine racemase